MPVIDKSCSTCIEEHVAGVPCPMGEPRGDCWEPKPEFVEPSPATAAFFEAYYAPLRALVACGYEVDGNCPADATDSFIVHDSDHTFHGADGELLPAACQECERLQNLFLGKDL